MPDLFVDPVIGSDSNVGSEAAPFLTIQHAINNAVPADVIKISNKAAFIEGNLTFNTGFTGSTTESNWLTFRVWNNGTIVNGNGDPCFELNGNDSFTSIFDTTPSYIALHGFIAHDYTGPAIQNGNVWLLANFEVYGCGGSEQVSIPRYSRVLNGIIRDPDTNTRCATAGSVSWMDGLQVYGASGSQPALAITNDFCSLINSKFWNNDVPNFGNIFVSRRFCNIAHNTINGLPNGNSEGLEFWGRANVIYNNLIANFSGANGKPLKFSNSGVTQTFVGYNSFYNNATTEVVPISGSEAMDQDIVETADPFTDEPNADFSLVETALSKDTGYPDAG